MTQMSQVTIENFINKHLVHLLWGIALYFLVGMANDFKDVKITLQQLLINQATIESRLTNTEANDKKQDALLDKLNESRINQSNQSNTTVIKR